METKNNSGCLLASLETELFPSKSMLEKTVLVHGLFLRRSALSPAHALDNARIREFMDENQTLLSEEEVDDRKSPLFAITGRTGANLREAVNLYLNPKGPDQRPTYLTSLSPETNGRLGEKYDQLKDSRERWERFVQVAGSDFIDHVDRATKYFTKHSQALIPPVSDRGFFESARVALSGIDRDSLSPLECGILDGMFRAMENWNPAEGYQSRERLHEAVYSGHAPARVWRGRIQKPDYSIKDSRVRAGWRYLVDAISNEHHADVHGLGVVTTPDLRIPRKLRGALNVTRYIDEKQVRLPAQILTKHLDLAFVLKIRRKAEFWDTLERLETAKSVTSALSEHLQVVSEGFKQYLIDEKKQPELVETTVAKIYSKVGDPIFKAATPAIAAMALMYGLDAQSTGILAAETGAAGVILHFVIEGFFADRLIEEPSFKSFITRLGKAGKSLFATL
jgi:hypothetical protein